MGNDGSTPASSPEQSQVPSTVGVTFPEPAPSALPAGVLVAQPLGAPAMPAAAASSAVPSAAADQPGPAVVGLTATAVPVAPAPEPVATAVAPPAAAPQLNAVPQAFPIPVRPPPLPLRAQPVPVQPVPVQSISPPPPLPFAPAFAPQAMPAPMPGPLAAPAYGYPVPEAQPPQPRSSWSRWGMPLFAVWFMLLLAGGFMAFYKSGRHGLPRRATASTPAVRPVYPGTTASPNGTAGKPGNGVADPFADPASSLKSNNRTGAAAAQRPARPLTIGVPLASLPRERDMDRELKRLWEACDRGGLRVVSIRTLKSSRTGAVTIQPARVSLEGSYENLTRLVRQMHASFPLVAIDTLDIAQPRGGAAAASAGEGPVRVPAEMLLAWRLGSDAPVDGSEGYDDSPSIPQPDLAPALGLLAAAADDHVMFTTVSIQAANRGKPGWEGRVGGFATSDIEVAGFLQQLSRAKGLAEVNLLTVDASAYASQPVRKFAVSFRPTGEGADNAARNSGGTDPFDPFRPTTALASSAGAPAGGSARVTPNAQLPTEDRAVALRGVQRLKLQAVMSGGNGGRSCMINNRLVHEGDTIDGFVVETVGDASAVVRKGKFRFELTVPK